MPRPFVKWAGGKAQLLKEIVKYLPKYEHYCEPFVGGGAVFFALTPKKAFLSDSNGELINAYQVVRDSVEDLMHVLEKYPNDKDFYLSVRAQNPLELSNVARAARFIYLNKTCFNGLYRVNKRNIFNVPFGNYKSPKICDKGVLRNASKALQGVELTATYFDNALSEVHDNSFVYLDPPYLPVSETSFVSYSKKGFDLEDHERLAQVYEELDRKGVKVMLSNSDTEWALDRYKDFRVVEVQSPRNINSKGDGRGKVKELIVINY